MKIDLHTHSNRSDGAFPPAEVVRRAHANGVDVLALTDHDGMEGVPEAAAEAARLGIRLVPGFELSTHRKETGEDIHILAYFCDPDDAELAGFLAGIREQRVARLAAMRERLREGGVDIPDPVPDAYEGIVSLGRPHLARELVTAGAASDVADAFHRFLHTRSRYYVPHRAPSPAEGVARIRAAGGVAVVAHPGVYKNAGFIDPLIEAGLGGIEVHHPDHKGKTARYRDWAARAGIAATGGSDYHGLSTVRFADIGDFTCPEEGFAALERAAAGVRA